MSDSRIADVPEIDVDSIQDGLKIPTGGAGNYTISTGTIADWLIKYKDLALKTYVDTELEKKADKGFVDTEFGKLGTASLYNIEDIALKNYVETELYKKADVVFVESEIDKLGTASLYNVEDLPISTEQANVNTRKIGFVDSVVSLLAIENPVDGQVVSVASHYKNLSLGGGTYKFEYLSTKKDNGGTYLANDKGVWVLISENYIENFGVTTDSVDQSESIQKALDYYLENNIKSFGFQKSNKYCISKPIKLKQSKVLGGEYYADPKKVFEFDFNGAFLEVLSDSQIAIVISRDCVALINPIITTKRTGVIGIYNGLDVENNDQALRRSSMRMILENPRFENLDVGMLFQPAETKYGAAWGSYYHSISNPEATNTNIMFMFKQSLGAGDNSNTRNTITGVKHVGGSCTIYGEALESSVFLGMQCEFITKPDRRLPNGEAVSLYLPFGTPSDYQANKSNQFIGYNVEVCTNYINVDAPETRIEGFFQGATNPRLKSWIYNNTYTNISQTEGGLRLRNYNKTPRLGLLQENDDGSNSSFYIEGYGDTNSHKIVSDGDVIIERASFDTITAKENRIEVLDKDKQKSLILLYRDDYNNPILSSSSGVLGFSGGIEPIFDLTYSLGTADSRIKNVHTGSLNLSSLKVFETNADALLGGLVHGDVYSTSLNQLMVVV